GAGMLVFFEHKHPRSLGDHKAIAVGREWTRGALRLVVPRLCERPQQRIAFDDAGGDCRIYASNQKHRLHTGLNMLIGVADRISRRGTACGDYVAVSAKAKAHADFAGDRAHGPAGDTEQAGFLFLSRVPQPVLLFGKFLRAATRAENYSDLTLFLH